MRTVRPGLLLLAAATLLAAACKDDDRSPLFRATTDLTGRWTLSTPPCTGICPEIFSPTYLLELERLGTTLEVTLHSYCEGPIGGGQSSIEGRLVHLTLDCFPNDATVCPYETCAEFHGTYDLSRVEGELTTTLRWPAAGDECPERTTTGTLPYTLSPGWPDYLCHH